MIEKTPMIDKRISTYLCELVLDQRRMEEYWRNKKETLERSGLTPAQQRILLRQDYSAISKALLPDYAEWPGPLVAEHLPPPPPPPGPPGPG